MKRRPDESVVVVPPVELTDYQLWCAARGVPAFGDPGDPVSMRAAVDRWAAWEGERARWATAHGVDEGDPVLDWQGSAPFDPDSV